MLTSICNVHTFSGSCSFASPICHDITPAVPVAVNGAFLVRNVAEDILGMLGS